jgi:hypothetical protein
MPSESSLATPDSTSKGRPSRSPAKRAKSKEKRGLKQRFGFTHFYVPCEYTCSELIVRLHQPLTDNDIKGLTTLQLITHSRGTVEGNDDSAGIWTWFELRIRKKNEVYSRELPNGQFLAWFSHPNSFGMENSGWVCRSFASSK